MSGYPEVSARSAAVTFLSSSSLIWLHFVCRSECSVSRFPFVGLCGNVGSELEEEMNRLTSFTTESGELLEITGMENETPQK